MKTTTTAQKRAIRLDRKKKAEQEYKDWLKQQADQAAINGQAEAERIKAKISLPPAESEGKFEVRFAQQLIEIMTGKPTSGRPTLIKMPETDFEPIALVLSSTDQFYYRTTPNHCPCKGWFYSVERFGVGKCRHHTQAFPEQAKLNAAEIERIKAARKAKPPAKAARVMETKDLSPVEMKALAAKLDDSLKGHSRFKYVLPKIEGIQSFEIRYRSDDQLIGENQLEEAEVQAMIRRAKAMVPAGVEVYASCF